MIIMIIMMMMMMMIIIIITLNKQGICCGSSFFCLKFVTSHAKTILTDICSNGKTHGYRMDDKRVA